MSQFQFPQPLADVRGPPCKAGFRRFRGSGSAISVQDAANRVAPRQLALSNRVAPRVDWCETAGARRTLAAQQARRGLWSNHGARCSSERARTQWVATLRFGGFDGGSTNSFAISFALRTSSGSRHIASATTGSLRSPHPVPRTPPPADERAEQQRYQHANAEPDGQTKREPSQDIAGTSDRQSGSRRSSP